ncbi:hypothetical protein TNCV_1951371 [Trichonephila clavipes]|nr:hypothetical protein TNCV_1951371 [Trichonephila clavipes]
MPRSQKVFKKRKGRYYPRKVKADVSEKKVLPCSSESTDKDGHESINMEYRLPLKLSESDGTAITGKVKEGVSEKKVLPYSSKSADNDSHESIKGKIERILAIINECISEKTVLPCSSKSADNDGHESINKEYLLTLRLSECGRTAIAGEVKEGVSGKKVLPCSSKSADNDGHESIKGKIESILALIDKCAIFWIKPLSSLFEPVNAATPSVQTATQFAQVEGVACFRIITGHDYLQTHLLKIGLADSPLCPLCNSVPITREHLSAWPVLLHVLSQDNCGVLLPARATSALYWTARRLMFERTLAGVRVKNTLSSSKNINCDVAQGSLLGPLLFH